MKRVLLFSLFLALVATFNAPVSYADEQAEVDRAVATIQAFRDMPEKSIPPEVLRNAQGVAILTVYKAGFVVSGRGGTGVVVARTNKGWSGPSSIGTGGAGFGFQIGASETQFIFILNNHEAVEAAVPVGRTAEADITPVAAVYAYSRSQGLFAGASLEGTVIGARDDTNANYYGRPITPGEILFGKVKAPPGARKLQKALARY